MPPLFPLTIMAQDHELFHGRVQGLVAPGAEGYFGVLARHAPMVAQLGPGVLSTQDEYDEEHIYAVSGGFLEVTKEGVFVLAEAAEAAEEIDVARARAAEERARLHLHEETADIARAHAALQRALVRLKVANKDHSLR